MTTLAARRRSRERRGRAYELLAAATLVLKGYGVLARRYKTRVGEIDIIAVRGRRLAFFEVKLRRSFAEAEAAIGPRQRRRVRRAADLWLAKNPRYLEHDQTFDLIFLVPWRWPRHLENAL